MRIVWLECSCSRSGSCSGSSKNITDQLQPVFPYRRRPSSLSVDRNLLRWTKIFLTVIISRTFLNVLLTKNWVDENFWSQNSSQFQFPQPCFGFKCLFFLFMTIMTANLVRQGKSSVISDPFWQAFWAWAQAQNEKDNQNDFFLHLVIVNWVSLLYLL